VILAITKARPRAVAGLFAAGVALTAIALGLTAQPVRAVVPDKGDLYVGLDNGVVQHYTNTGHTRGTPMDSMTGSIKSTGMCFDASGNLFSTQLSANTVSKFSASGALISSHFGSGYNQGPESCVVNAAGQILVGQAGGSHDVLKFDSSGNLIARYSPTVGPGGTDWIDLGGDQCTLYYTSLGSVVRRFNVCTNSQMSDFATAPSGPCYAHRVRPNGEVLLTCSDDIYRFDPAGHKFQSYRDSLQPAPGVLVSLNLDPDNASFWTADAPSRVYRVNIAPPGLLLFTFPIPSVVGGLAVVGEPQQMPSPSPSATPTETSLPPGPPGTGRN
jgi:sugar lactone lactonase YvrE